MSNHGNDTPEIKEALAAHGLATDTPSQLSDAFRLGWKSSEAVSTEEVKFLLHELELAEFAQDKDRIKQIADKYGVKSRFGGKYQ